MTALRKADDNQTDLQALLVSLEPKIRQAFLEAINTLKDQKTLDQIVTLLEAGRVNDAMDIIQKHISVFASNTISYYTIAGQVAAQSLSDLVGVLIGFNQTNSRAVALMQQARLRLISEFTDEQRAVVRQVMVSGIERGINPRLQAQEFKNFIGLTERQMQAVNNYRRLLEQNSTEALTRALRDRRFDSTIQRAVDNGNTLTKDQIDRMVDRYAQRQLDFRAETIARTEALRTVNQASQESLLQAVELDEIDPNEVIQEWITANDERVRSSHAAMQGQKQPLGQPFVSGDGNELDYPGDPKAPAKEVINCRCVLTTRLTNIKETSNENI